MDDFPTAVQAVALVHETRLSALSGASLALGVDWISQVEPFQCSARVNVCPAPLWKDPTALHAIGDVHATPLSTLSVAPLGLGVDWISQSPSLQRSASVTCWPE